MIKLPITTLFTIFFFLFFLFRTSYLVPPSLFFSTTIPLFNVLSYVNTIIKEGRKRRKQNHNILKNRKVSNVCSKVRDPSILQ